MQTSEHAQATPTKTLIGKWPPQIPQSSLDHLVWVLARRTKARIVAEPIDECIHVHTFGDLADALLHFEMISGSFCVR